MIKTISSSLFSLVLVCATLTMPAEARHHTRASGATTHDNSPASHFSGKWTGILSGNDRHVRAVMILNNSGTHYTGTLLGVSDKTGTCKRELTGHYDPKTHACILKDVRILYSRSPKGIHFCLRKIYDLQLGSDSVTLSGTYESPECQDLGSVDLSKPKTPPKHK